MANFSKINKIAYVFLIALWSKSFSETFVLPKKQKKVSLSRCKQNVCQLFADQISLIPSVQIETAFIQKKIFDKTLDYVESAKTGFFAKATKQEMLECQKFCREFDQAQKKYLHACKKYSKFLRTLT